MPTADMQLGTMIENRKAVHVSTRLYAISIERSEHTSPPKKAVQIAHLFDSIITMLNVHPEFIAHQKRDMFRVSFDGLKEKYRRIAVESREEMKTEIGKLHAEDIQVDFVLREGRPERVIVETTGGLGIDLIVICTDGRYNINWQQSSMP